MSPDDPFHPVVYPLAVLSAARCRETAIAEDRRDAGDGPATVVDIKAALGNAGEALTRRHQGGNYVRSGVEALFQAPEATDIDP